MFELIGQYTSAKVMADRIDSATRSQIYAIISNPAFTNPISIMQDCHKGAGAVIGFTMEMGDKIIPNIVGRDKGCGVLSFNIGRNIFHDTSRKEIDVIIRNRIPFGSNVHSGKGVFDIRNKKFWQKLNFQLVNFTTKFNSKHGTNYSYREMDYREFTEICKRVEIDSQRAFLSLGTLGSGNHFIEVGKSKDTKDYWTTIHSGSRQFGSKVCMYWQRKAGKGELAYLTGEDMFNYLSEMLISQTYAEENRGLMKEIVLNILNVEATEIIESVHNYMDYSDWIIRKGAISSYKDQKIVIPLNMEDGILVCKGKSNPEWNFSAPHGAGRVDSRRWAKENLSKKDAKDRMKDKDIYYSALPLDETRDAYKDGQMIKDSLDPTATLIEHIKPVLVIKDGEDFKYKKFKNKKEMK